MLRKGLALRASAKICESRSALIPLPENNCAICCVVAFAMFVRALPFADTFGTWLYMVMYFIIPQRALPLNPCNPIDPDPPPVAEFAFGSGVAFSFASTMPL